MKAKKLHTDECYVCIISFIRSVLALRLDIDIDIALVLMVLALLTSLQSAIVNVSAANVPIRKFSGSL